MGQLIPFPEAGPIERIRRIRRACTSIYVNTYPGRNVLAALGPTDAAAIETMVNTYVLAKVPIVWLEGEATRIRDERSWGGP